MKKTVFITIGIVIGLILILNIFVPDPKFKNTQEQLDFAISSKQYPLAEKLAIELIQEDSLNIENYYTYLKQHFNRPESEGRYGPDRDDKPIHLFFAKRAKSNDTIISDIGMYGLGLYNSLSDNNELALTDYLKVGNKKLKYLNNSIGVIYNRFNRLDSAEFYFKKEIVNNGNLEGAYYNLSKLLKNAGRFNELQSLSNDSIAKLYLSISTEMEVSFYFHHYGKYIESILIEPIKNAKNYLAFISALLILFTWLIYLKRINVFESENWKNIFIVFLLGSLFTFFVYPISDIINIHGNFRLNGNILNDFIYSVLAIGFVEELVKIIPLLLILKYSKIINEPIDYIIYASVSALGFAFIENIKYFDYAGLEIIHGRALISVIVHMFNSSLIAYGIVYNKLFRKKNKYLNFVVFLLLASFVHGFFDFWILNKNVEGFAIFSVLTVFAQISLFNSFINNTLNQSNFYTPDKKMNNEKLQIYLFVTLSSIFIFEYLAVSMKYCVSAGNSALLNSIKSGSFILFFITTRLSRFKIHKGSWEKMNYWDVKVRIDYAEDIVGMQVVLTKFTKNRLTDLYLSNEGQVICNLSINEQPNWYYIKLSRQIKYTNYSSEFVMVNPRDDNEKLQTQSKMLVALYLVKNDDLPADEIKKDDLKFVGWARVN